MCACLPLLLLARPVGSLRPPAPALLPHFAPCVQLAWNHQVKMYPAAVGRVLGVRHAREAWGVEDHKPFPFPHIQVGLGLGRP